jgi:hypothetical protein
MYSQSMANSKHIYTQENDKKIAPGYKEKLEN